MKKFLIIFTVALLLSACASPPEKSQRQGQIAYSQQKYHAAFLKLFKAAEAQVPTAEYAVGYMLYYGIGVKQNMKQAFYWMVRAAHNGSNEAKAALKRLSTAVPNPTLNS